MSHTCCIKNSFRLAISLLISFLNFSSMSWWPPPPPPSPAPIFEAHLSDLLRINFVLYVQFFCAGLNLNFQAKILFYAPAWVFPIPMPWNWLDFWFLWDLGFSIPRPQCPGSGLLCCLAGPTAHLCGPACLMPGHLLPPGIMPLHAQHTPTPQTTFVRIRQTFPFEMHQGAMMKSMWRQIEKLLEMTGCVVTEGSGLSWEEEVKVGRSVRDCETQLCCESSSPVLTN